MGQPVKRIAVLCNYQLLPERIGGMDYFFWNFNQKCSENNIQVDWFFPNLSQHGRYKELAIFETHYENVEHYFLNHYAHKQYDSIITHFIELCTSFFKMFKKVSQANVIVVDHNPKPIHGFGWKKKVEKRIKGILFSKYIDQFISVSEYSRQQIIKDFGMQIKPKCKVIFNGLDTKKYSKKTNVEIKGKCIVASHLRKEKGIQDLILAVSRLVNDVDFNVVIDVFGDGVYKEELQKMVASFSLQQYFVFKGSVSNLHEIYHEYDFLIHPSHGETFCFSVVESLLSNLPVITTEHQGNVLGLIHPGKNGYLYEVGDIDGLKKILKTKLSTPLIIDSHDVEQQFALENMVQHYFNLLQ
jgi:L-malate glycosyltransferase